MRSIVSFLATAVLLLSLLTACGNTDKTDEARTVTNTPAAAQTTNPAPAGNDDRTDLGEDMRDAGEDMKEDGQDVVNDLVGEDGNVADGNLDEGGANGNGNGNGLMEDERDADENTARAGQ